MGNFYSCRWRLPNPDDVERNQLYKLSVKIDDNGWITLPLGWNIGKRLDISGYYFIYDWSSIKIVIENNTYRILSKSKDTEIELK